MGNQKIGFENSNNASAEVESWIHSGATTPTASIRKLSDARPLLIETPPYRMRPGSSQSHSHMRPGSAQSQSYKWKHIALQEKINSIMDEDVPPRTIRMSVREIPATQLPSPEIPAPSYRTGGARPRTREDALGTDTYHQYPDSCVSLEKMADLPRTPGLEPFPMFAPAIKMSKGAEALFIGVVAASHFCTQAGLGLVLAPIDMVARDLNVTSPTEQSWFIASYGLTVGTFILIAGRLGDMLGHKRMLAFGYAWFGVFCAFAGFAVYPRNQIYFDVCRALQGIGPALIMPNGLALFGRAYPPGMKKNIVFSIFGAVAPAGFVAGATFGSIFARFASWPWAFWAFTIALWGLALLTLIVVPRELSEKPTNPPTFDWAGTITGVSGLVLFNVAWNNAPIYGWNTAHVYFLLIIGIICLFAFVYVEKRAESPLIPVQAMSATVNFVLACTGLGWGAFAVWIFFSFRFLQLIRGVTPLLSSTMFAPAVICGLLAAGLTGFMLTHTPVSFTMMVSMMAFCIGIVIAATMPANQSYWAQMFVSIIIMPFGMDMSFPAASVILSNHMPPEHQGLAMSLVNTVVNYSISISLGIAGTVEVSVADGLMNSPKQLFVAFRAAFHTAVGLSGAGVLCGAIFFLRTYKKEGWNIMDH